jgi:hypothetical protein
MSPAPSSFAMSACLMTCGSFEEPRGSLKIRQFVFDDRYSSITCECRCRIREPVD